MDVAPEKPSIYDLPPIETGGARNREGLAFQDHVTAGYCLELLEQDELVEVWCETQDDITLVWKNAGEVAVEFVQAKSDAFDQLWSISQLCQRDGGKEGSSIVEKSLSNDRCREAVLFRIVTVRPFMSDLAPLTLERDCAARGEAKQEFESVETELSRRVGTFRSANGNDCRTWLKRVVLDARHDESSVIDSNRLKFQHLLERFGFESLHDQTLEIYLNVVARIAETARLDARIEKAKKRFTREGFEKLFKHSAEAYLYPAVFGGGRVLQAKMIAAGLPRDTIASAQELRRSYRRKSLVPKYQKQNERPLLDEEVTAMLQILRSRLDCGVLPDNGGEFFSTCLERLEAYRHSLPPERRPLLSELQGSMYVIADRCLHRFRRASP